MKKIYLLGLSSLLFLGATAAPRNISFSEARQLKTEGKVKTVPAYAAKQKTSTGLKSRTTNSMSHTGKVSTVNPFKQALKPSKAPSRVTAGGSNIYGYLVYSENSEFVNTEAFGLYELTENGYELAWLDPIYEELYATASTGWYTEGKVNGVFPDIFWGMIFGYYSYSIDFATGELLDLQTLDTNSDVIFYYPKLNTEDNKIYGYAYNMLDGGELWWAEADADDPGNATLIAFAGSENFCYALCYNPTDGYFYGITASQNFVRIGLDGSQTVICPVPFGDDCATYMVGLVFSPVENLFYWNVNYDDDTAALVTITPDGQFTQIEAYHYCEEFTYFITTDEVVNPDKPSRPSVVSNEFKDGSLTGDVVFELPKTFGDERPLPSSIAYVSLLDGETYNTGYGAPGEKVTVTYTVPTSGFHSFGLFVTVGDESSSTASVRVYIGNDTPVAPANVKLTDTELTWDAVTTGVNNGYVDAAAVSYIVYLNDKEIGTTTATSYDVSSYIDPNAPLDLYKASVVAVCNGLESAPGLSNSVVAGSALVPPVFLSPTQNEFALMTSVDLNGLGPWSWGNTGEVDYVYCGYTYDPSQQMDSYLFLPPVNIADPSKYYEFSFLSGIRSDYYPEEYLEVVYATAADPKAVIGTIIPEFKVTAVPANDEWQNESGLLIAPAAGEYYIAIHCVSDGDQLGVMCRNFALDNSNITGASPAAAGNVTATAGAQGALEATVTFTFPTKTLGGDDIASGTTLMADVTVNGSDELKSVTGTPGSTGTATVKTLQGTNTIQVVVYNGELESPKVRTSVYTGVSVPATPTGLVVEAAPDMMSAVLTWNPVTTPDVEGGYIDPEDITYTILQYYDLGFFGTWMVIDEGITDTTYTFNVYDGDPQDQYQLGVASSNDAGSNGYLTYGVAFLGTPYGLPFVENLDNGDEVFSTNPWYMYSLVDGVTYDGSWVLDYMSGIDPSYDGEDRTIIVGFSQTGDPCQGALGLPRFSTLGQKKVDLTLNLVRLPYASRVTLYGEIYGSDELIEIGTCLPVDMSAISLKEFSFELPEELLNQYWVQVYIIADYAYGDELFGLAGVNITGDTTGILSLTADSAITAGKNTIVVRGFEGQDVTIATLDGKKVASGVANSKEATFSVTPGIYVVKAGGTSAKVVVK